ncbi:MAG: pyridoxal phosphate-dependent aminotransferase [Brevinema sp.]
MIFSLFSGKAIRSLPSFQLNHTMLDIASEEISYSSPEIIDAAERIMRIPETFVKPCPALKERLKPSTGNIIFTAGAKNALNLIMATCLNPNDEVLLFAPHPAHYAGAAYLAGALVKTVRLDEEESFFPDLDILRTQISPHTRMIVLSNPQNPTGVMWDKETLQGIIKLAKEKNVVVVSDESASSFIYEGSFVSLAEISPTLDNVVIIKDLTASMALSGWHMATIVACSEFCERAEGIQALSLGGINTSAQHILHEAWDAMQARKAIITNDLQERRNLLVSSLRKQHGFRVITPMAGLSIFPYMRYYLGNEIAGKVPNTSTEFSQILVDAVGVWVEPGLNYGLDGFFKCSFAQAPNILSEAVQRMASVLEKGKPK